MHLSEQPDYLESEFSESHIEEYWEGEALEIDRDAVLEYYRGELECRALVGKEKSWDSDWWAEDNVRHHLEHRSFIPPGEADYLRHTMADQLRIDIEGRRKESGEGRYLENKFSDRSKAKEPYRRIKHAFEMAAEKGYRRGTRVSLSTYNKWHDSFEDEISNLNASLSGVFDNLRRDDLLGSTPDRVGVIEFTNSGLPHAHVVFFGVSPKQFPKAWLQDYWENTREQGKEIEVNEVGYSESRDQWLFGDGETPVSEYYTQTAKMMLDVAEGGDPRELTRQGGDHWKLAMHWASDEISQHERISDSLVGDDIEESIVLDVTPRWISSGGDSFRDVRVGRDESSLDGKCGFTGCSKPLLNSGPWYQGLPPPCYTNVKVYQINDLTRVICRSVGRTLHRLLWDVKKRVWSLIWTRPSSRVEHSVLLDGVD